MGAVHQHRRNRVGLLQKFNIRDWVKADPDRLAFRQAVHTILIAISGTPFLQTSMIMKGGVLLTLAHNSSRYSQDIDFSTAVRLPEFDKETFRKALDEALALTVETLGYGLDCRIQGFEQNPKGEDASFPTIKTRIGYAYKNEAREHKRLLAGQSIKVIKLDYSLNEPVGNVDIFDLDEGNAIRVYGLIELVAEKFRALLQQESRKRVRGQDLYDLWHLFTVYPFLTSNADIQKQILDRLIEKSAIRSLTISVESMSDENIRRRTREGYGSLSSEAGEDLPPFEKLYGNIEAHFQSLPWHTLP